MRHKKKLNHLSRKRGHRQAMLSNMATSLILNKRIKTTTAKAKALKIYLEPLITKAKKDTTHSRRQVFSYLQDKDATAELFREIAEKVADRPGGYTRIIKLGNRLGDNADMCIIELVDYNENLLAEKAAEKKSSSRRRRGGKKKTQEQPAAVTEAEATETKAAEADAPEAATEAETSVEAEKDTAADEAKEEADAAPEAAEPKAETQAPEAETVEEKASDAESAKEEPKAEKKEAEDEKSDSGDSSSDDEKKE